MGYLGVGFIAGAILILGLVYINDVVKNDVAKDESIVRQCVSVAPTLTKYDQDTRYDWLKMCIKSGGPRNMAW